MRISNIYIFDEINQNTSFQIISVYSLNEYWSNKMSNQLFKWVSSDKNKWVLDYIYLRMRIFKLNLQIVKYSI